MKMCTCRLGDERCPLCKAAPEMYEALKYVIHQLEHSRIMSGYVQRAIYEAEQALSKVDSKEN